MKPSGHVYRPEIDGLRAVAVVLVLLYHAGLLGVRGGFIGVDVFFVISGYLITGIIARDLDAGTFSWRHFIERRARRLLPALVVMLALVTPVAWAILLPGQLVDYSRMLAASLGFVGNFHLLRAGSTYFHPDLIQPLLHLWSLGIEEQFYLVFPLAMIVGWRWRWGSWIWYVGGGALASFGLCMAWAAWWPDAAFYLLPARAWELLAGSAVALLERRHARLLHALPLCGALSLLALTGLIITAVGLSRFWGFPYPFALVPVAGSVAVIALTRPGQVVHRLLASPPLVWTGKISYSLYLWHFPLLVLAQAAWPALVPVEMRVALLAVSVLLAWLSWRFVERPFRDQGLVSFRRLGLSLLPMIGLLLVASLTARLLAGAPQRFPQLQAAVVATATAQSVELSRCLPGATPSSPIFEVCPLTDGAPLRIALVGDSHAAALKSHVARAARFARSGAVMLARAGCPPIAVAVHKTKEHDNCADYNRRTLAWLHDHPEIDTVVIAARWPLYLAGVFFDNQAGGVEPGHMFARPMRREQSAQVRDAIRRQIEALAALKRRIILVYPLPEAGWNVPFFRWYMNRLGLDPTLPRTRRAVVDARVAASHELLDSVTAPNVVRLRPAAALCDAQWCNLAGATPYYVDDDHLSDYGARTALPNLPALLNVRPAPPASPARR